MKFTPVEDDPFAQLGEFSKSLYTGAFGDPQEYAKQGAMSLPRAAGLATGQVLGGYAKGIYDAFGKVLRAAHGEAVPRNELIDAANAVASSVGTGGLAFGRAPSGALAANMASFPKEYLLKKVPEELQKHASDIYDAGVKSGWGAYTIANNFAFKHPDTSVSSKYLAAGDALAAAMNPPPITLAKSAAVGEPLQLQLLPSSRVDSSLLKSMDWSNYIPPEGQLAAFNQGAANKLAIEQGYNTATPLFKGGKFEGEGFRTPKSNKSEPALFFATDPNVAKEYGGQIVPAYARANNPLQVDWKEVTGKNDYSNMGMSNLLLAAKRRDADLLAIHGIGDIASTGFMPQTQIAIFDPTILRSPWANFDPNKLWSSDLLASRGAPIFVPVDHDPWKEQSQ